jgi:glutathione S-transferase
MPMVNAVIALALLEYVIFAMLVGKARVTYGVAAPAVSGNEMFERYYRVQMNTIEQLIIFVPASWMFGQFISEFWAAILGLVFILGRAMYLQSYVADPAKRGASFGLSFFPNMALLIGGLYGALRAM